MFRKQQDNGGTIVISSYSLTTGEIEDAYGAGACECTSLNSQMTLVFSQARPFDLVELEELLRSVGWSQRPIGKVRRALDNSLLKVGLWRHDPSFPRLIGFARCTGDGVLEATIWDVAINPIYQGFGLGKQLMTYVNKSLKEIGIRRITLFADPGVVKFYKTQGWVLEPKGHRCAFWYAN